MYFLTSFNAQVFLRNCIWSFGALEESCTEIVRDLFAIRIGEF